MTDSRDQMASVASLLKGLEDAIIGITATKYLSVAGFVVLIYDHTLLFDQEVRYIWEARWNFIKGVFIANSYLIPACLLISNMELSGILGFQFSDFVCKFWISATGILAVVSLGGANAFIIYRLYLLWNRDKTVLKVLVSAFTVTYLCTLGLMGFASHQFIPLVSWSPVLKTCTLSHKPTIIVAVWACPIVFDIFILIMACWNALSRPRDLHTAVTTSLYRDGIVLFLMLTLFRVFNIIVITMAPLPLIQLAIYAVWAFMACIVNRLLIQHQKVNGYALSRDVLQQEEMDNSTETNYIEMDYKPSGFSSLVYNRFREYGD